MGKFLEFVFNRFFLGMLATAFFWLLTLAGGIVFGLAPASATLMSLYAEHGYSYQEQSHLLHFYRCGFDFDLWPISPDPIASPDHFSSLGDLSQYPCCCLCFFGLYRFIEATSLLRTFLSKYCKTRSYRNFYEFAGNCQGFIWYGYAYRNWLLYARLAFLRRNWYVAFLYQ